MIAYYSRVLTDLIVVTMKYSIIYYTSFDCVTINQMVLIKKTRSHLQDF